MTTRIVALALGTALIAGCSRLHVPSEPPAPVDGATPIEVVAPILEPPPPEFPAVVLRVRRAEDGFVAEVLDVRGAEPDPRPIVGEARRDAVRRVEHLLGDRARVVDPDPLPSGGDRPEAVGEGETP